MQGFTVENEGLRTYLAYRPQDAEGIDTFGRGMLMANDIEGIIPIMQDSDGSRKIRYDITGMDRIEEYLGGGVEKEEQLRIFDDVLRFVLGAEQYLLDSSMFVMDIGHVYMDADSGRARLLYLPVKRALPEPKINERIRVLFKNVLFSSKYFPEKDNGYVAELINGLNNKAEFSPADFFRILKRLKASAEAEGAAGESGTGTAFDAAYEAGDGGGDQPAFIYSEPSVEDSVYSGNSGKDDKKDSVFVHLKKMFFSKPDAKSNAEGFAGYGSGDGAKALVVAEDSKNTYLGTPDDKPDADMEGKAFLYRSSKGERIAVDKKLFKIGKGAAGNNYRIKDNVAVSALHAEIAYRDGRFYITDLGSLNNTYVNGEKLPANMPKELAGGDAISLADEEFSFYC